MSVQINKGHMLFDAESVDWVDSVFASMASPEVTARLESAKAHFGDSENVDFWGNDEHWARPYNVVDGTLIIPVKGVLRADFPYQFDDYATGYEYIRAAVERGLRDPKVTRIALDVDSPGGVVSGLFDLVDYLFEAAKEKTFVGAANEFAFSAAYAILSVASHITVTRTGGVGSIGVMRTHREISESLKQRGIKVTHIIAGEEKKDGNSFEPLSKRAQKTMQARTDYLYGIFVASVARNRGLDEAAVRGTKAGTFLPQEAVKLGLADEVRPFDDYLSALAENSTTYEREIPMAKNALPTDQAALDALLETARTEAVAAAQATSESATTEAANAATAAERTRIATIRGTEVAKARPVATEHAVESGMSIEDAATFLGKMPKEASTTEDANESSFEEQMNKDGGPNLGSGEDGDDKTPDRAATVTKSVQALGLAGFKTPEA